jgi:hypothetical protein
VVEDTHRAPEARLVLIEERHFGLWGPADLSDREVAALRQRIAGELRDWAADFAQQLGVQSGFELFVEQ